MTPDTYVIGSILFSVIVAALLHSSKPSDSVSIDDALKCPRCGATMEDIGSGVSGVVQSILVLRCPQCGYEERSWGEGCSPR